MLLSRVLQDMEIDWQGAVPDREISGVCCDSRLVKPGFLFVAIRGFQTDGHRFISKALENGAAAVLCEEASPLAPCAVTTDSRLGLALASRRFYRTDEMKMRLIGVTGTNGKTTSAFLIKQLLEKVEGARVGLMGSIVNMVGDEELHSEHTTPESCDVHALLRRMEDAGCRYCVMEVSSHSLVLHRVAGLRFDVGLFTNLTQDHLDFHGTMENYALAKALFPPQCGVFCVNADDGWAETVSAGANELRRFAVEREADLRAENVRLESGGVEFEAVSREERCPVRLDIPGRLSVYTALTALSACVALGLPLERCAAALGGCRGARGRLERVPGSKDYSIYIDYAVTPDAVENILRTLRAVAPGRLVMLFGCGGDRDRGKRPIMGEIAARLSDFVIVTSDNPRTEEPEAIIREILPGVEGHGTPYVVIPDRVEAIRYAMEHHQKDDVVLLCGKGHEDYQIIGTTKIHLDEREVVAQVLKELEK